MPWSRVAATTFRVPDTYPTIASAVNVATKGDTILISPGIHTEPDFVHVTSGLRLIGDGTWETVTVDFEGMSIQPLPAGDSVATIVEHIGFESLDGGVQKFDVIRNPLTIVRHNRFFTNGAVRFRGGARFEHNIVIMSQPESPAYTIEAVQGSTAEQADLTFAYNVVSLSSGGFFFSAEGSIAELRFHHNTLVYPLWGPGGFSTSMSGWDYGGGEYVISSNIFWGVWLGCSDYDNIGGSIEFLNNCFEPWIRDPEYPCPDPAAGTDNIVEDPLLCDLGQPWFEAFDWRLAPTSPCIGTGEGGANIGALGAGCGLVDVAVGGGPFTDTPIVVSPTPTSGSVEVRIRAVRAPLVALSIYDPSGGLVSRLDDGLRRGVGGQTIVRWDGVTLTGHRAPSGVYFVRGVDAGGRTWTSKVVLAR